MITAVMHYSDWVDVWPWFRFSPWEMSDRKSGALIVDTDFMDWLMKVRTEFGQPMTVTSGYRTPEHQKELPGGRATGPHVDAQAVDIAVYGASALELIRAATALGCYGLGVKQTGSMYGRFLHLDRWKPPVASLRPTVWSY